MNSQVVERLQAGDYQRRLHAESGVYLVQEMVWLAEW